MRSGLAWRCCCRRAVARRACVSRFVFWRARALPVSSRCHPIGVPPCALLRLQIAHRLASRPDVARRAFGAVCSLSEHARGCKMTAGQTAMAPLPCLRRPTRCTCRTSCAGHSEPAAGLTGLGFAMQQASQRAALPVLHLRTPNPHVCQALDAAGGAAAAMPRQAQPLMLPAAAAAAEAGVRATRSTFGDGAKSHEALVMGVSAFAFQVRLRRGRWGSGVQGLPLPLPCLPPPPAELSPALPQQRLLAPTPLQRT